MEDFVLTLAIKPSATLVAKINSWLEAEIENRVNLTIKTDKKIIGGAIIEYKGRYKDFSLRKLMERKIRT